MMKIRSADLFHYNAPFRYGYPSAHLFRNQADSVLVALRCGEGLTGYGESVPRPYVTGENVEMVRETFAEVFTPLLVGREVDSVPAIEGLLKELQAACLRKGITRFQSALGAVDMALLDALAKGRGLPVWQLLGEKIRDDIPWSLVIPMIPDELLRKYSALIVPRTFSSIKVLVERDVERNLKRISLVRELMGEGIPMRVEVNGHWTMEEACANLAAMTGYGITAVEQPLAKGSTEGLRELRQRFGIPVIVDESLCSPEDAESLIAAEACDILNIKISKVGGILAARRIASFAAANGIPCQLGNHVGETGLLTSAAFHFLVTAPNLTLIEGISDFLYDDLAKMGSFSVGRLLEGMIDEPGLGFNAEVRLAGDWLASL